MQKKVGMPQLEPILLQSIEENEGVLDFLRKMEREIGTAPPAQLLEFNALLTDLQGRAIRTDQVLLLQLTDQAAKPEKLQTLIEKRERIIRDILMLNAGITTKALGVKSHLAFELGKLRHGLSAMNGYKQLQNNQGRIVNRSS
jgi:hypothetical protein